MGSKYVVISRTIEDTDDPFMKIERVNVRIELKPCPYCGNVAQTEHESGENGEDWLYIKCTKCGNRTRYYEEYHDVAEAWNKRRRGISLNARELAECPHCGGKAEYHFTDEPEGSISYYVECQKCGARTPASNDKNKVRRKWNARIW